MATNPINKSNGIMSSLSTVAAQDAAKSKDASAVLNNPAAASNANANSVASKPNVNISAGARDRADASARALDIARNTPDIREDRVSMLKKQIEDGSYQIDSGKIADGMMREAILDHLAESDER